MSHISKIEIEIKDLSTLKQACQRLNLQFLPEQKTYKWYGRWVGDGGPLPEGITVEDLGKCDHAIRVPHCEYEIGVIKRGRKYLLLWDSWRSGGLAKALGKNAGLLKQAYAIARVHQEAKLKGYRVREKKIENGIRLVLSR